MFMRVITELTILSVIIARLWESLVMPRDSFDLINDALRGNELDRIPVSLWRHFPRDDLDGEKLVDLHIKFASTTEVDLIKFSPMGRFSAINWGCEIYYPEETLKTTGSARCKEPIIKRMEDFTKIEKKNPQEGFFGETLRAVRSLARKVKEPVVLTVFSPLMTLSHLTNLDMSELLKKNPEPFREAVDAVTQTTLEFARVALEGGVAGIFFAHRFASPTQMDRETYLSKVVRIHRKILNDSKIKNSIIVHHAHGDKPFLDIISKSYSPGFLNWETQTTEPSIPTFRKTSASPIMGGLNENALETMSDLELCGELEQAWHDCGEKGFVIAPGCVIPINVPINKIKLVTKLARKISSGSSCK